MQLQRHESSAGASQTYGRQSPSPHAGVLTPRCSRCWTSEDDNFENHRSQMESRTTSTSGRTWTTTYYGHAIIHPGTHRQKRTNKQTDRRTHAHPHTHTTCPTSEALSTHQVTSSASWLRPHLVYWVVYPPNSKPITNLVHWPEGVSLPYLCCLFHFFNQLMGNVIISSDNVLIPSPFPPWSFPHLWMRELHITPSSNMACKTLESRAHPSICQTLCSPACLSFFLLSNPFIHPSVCSLIY